VWERLYAAKALTRDAQLLVEVRLDFGHYIPEAFGTADAVIIADGCIEVIDFKYGRGVKVSAWENPQMKIYALGALEAFGMEYDIRAVRMTIVQPRLDNLSEYEMTVEELTAWAKDVLKPKAAEAFAGGGEPVPGAWCQFCKVKGRCGKLAAVCTTAARAFSEPRLISSDDMAAKVLPLLPTIRIWLSSVEEYALQQALGGVQYKGFKVVEGRSVRKITDPQAVMNLLADNGFAQESYIRPTELRTITELEKIIGKKRFAELCADYISKPQGKPTLVPDSDKREVFNSAAEDFKNIDI